ncbi:MAG: ABC transporter ATP-binding protein [Anaerolineales bacterium]|nr:ABC transporter ATP-binding protein [Anaerolineales bacterium]
MDDASFSVNQGELLAVLGTNGTGKTTLLKCINRILQPAAGSVLIGGESVDALGRNALAQKIGYVEQQRSGSRATVFNAVLLGRKPYIRWDITRHDAAVADGALEALGMSGHAFRFLDELSGGELQKVNIARALAQEPEVLLMDEPTSNLDLKNQLEVLKLIRQITRDRGIAAVMAMHDLNLALRFADRFLFLKGRKIHAAGGPDVVTPEIIESVYSVPVTIVSHSGNRIIYPL